MEGVQPGWAALTGQSYEEYQGYGWSKVVHPDDAQPTLAAWQQAVQERRTFLFEHRIRQHNGIWGLYAIRAIPLFTPDGNVREWVGVHTDISEQRQAQQRIADSEARFRLLSAELEQQVLQRTGELQALVHDLQRSNENLQQFASIASHDLQEPLRKIQSFSDIVRNQYGSQLGDGVDYLERMQLAASRMSILIRDLLAYARISTHQDTTVPVSLTAVLRTTLENLDLLIEETGATLLIDELPIIPGDPVQLGQLFQNLVSNGLKFRQENRAPQIQIRCQLLSATSLPATIQPTRQALQYYLIEVADNGIGFDDKYTHRIFQVFQRLHGHTAYAGTGIGLAICEKVVANHGGAIWARSQPNQGATFSIYFPYR